MNKLYSFICRKLFANEYVLFMNKRAVLKDKGENVERSALQMNKPYSEKICSFKKEFAEKSNPCSLMHMKFKKIILLK